MPELPEVETTVRGLQKEIVGLKILDVWTDLNTKDKRKADTVANRKYFLNFKKDIENAKIISVKRRAKNILISLNNKQTILVHMKMTGNLLYQNNKNRKFVHVVFRLENNYELAFADMRKFGKITLLDTDTMHDTKHLQNIGPEPLDKEFTVQILKERLFKKQNSKIKTVLMDPAIVAGIGNIYSDEILWHAGIHPERKIASLKEKDFKEIYKNIKILLTKGINFGGDSMSDYRNIYNEKGAFQLHHRAYRRIGEKCSKKNCKGVIIRKVIGGRSTHFCSIHQK